ncbi:NAD(P) transhydrogenase subunit alpha [Aliiglaciecola lipolytica E3]|uniref:proton-translocating NAD(P)(+) transhydrogenase n=2 Tax=Aliiglaciecola TaxID=1406885 RepID=K6YBJ1_9ALTE|nr:NAD(P) transhydrogenase subunit alpha [Aliiglaciecola lipolytica E3]
MGFDVIVQAGAGLRSGYADQDYQDEGAIIGEGLEGIKDADLVLFVGSPSQQHISLMKRGAIIIGHINPFFEKAKVRALAKADVSTLSIEMIPRSSRAQKMDALSSQASLAGYVMMIEAAAALPRILPMMMTPSGTIKPAKVFVIGAGVAGLQAIATAKRMGANVLAYDTRSVVAEQVESLGAKFLYIDIGATGQSQNGYALALSDEQKQLQLDAQQQAIAEADIVITTAQLFGRRPPLLIPKATIALMKPGSVIVDMAAESGGNVEGSIAGKTIEVNQVTVIGSGKWSQHVVKDATEMYANNCFHLIDEFSRSHKSEKSTNSIASLAVDLEDEILSQCIITHQGQVCNEQLLKHYEGIK